MIRRKHILPILAAAIVFFALAPQAYHASEAFAAVGADPTGSPSTADLKTLDKDGHVVRCADYDKAKGGILLGRIVPCIVNTIQTSTVVFVTQMITLLQPLFYAYLTFVIVMFGVKVLEGDAQVHKQGFLLLLKIALVTTTLNILPTTVVPAVYGIMAETQDILTHAIDTNSLTCDVATYTGDNTPRVWAIMDCVMGKMWGFTAGTATPKQPSMLLGASLFGLASGFLFGGAFGVTVFFALVGVLVSVFVLVLRVVLAFLNGYLVICLMLIMLPLFMPLVFMKVTAGYFEGVWKNIVASFIMPTMITAYAMLALTLYDAMLFSDGTNGKPKSLISELFSYSKIDEAMQDPRAIGDCPITGDPTGLRNSLAAQDGAGNQIMKPTLQNFVNPSLAAAENPCRMAKVPVFKINKVKSADFANAKEAYTILFQQLVTLLLLGFLINEGLRTIMSLVSRLSGGGSTVAALMGPQSGGFEQKLQVGASEMQREARKATYSASTKDKAGNEIPGHETYGAEFLKRVVGNRENPGVIQAGAKGFFSGIKR
ncbi:MAG: hypothetical protein V4735_07750 [Pseudomonadota bacterium]